MKPALVILGATGTVGRGVVAAAVAAGRSVIAVSRQWRELRALRTAHAGADLAIVRGSVADDASSAQLAAALAALNRPIGSIVVSICGDCEKGRVLDHPADALRRMLEQNVLAHASAARALLPLLADAGGSYLLIGGPGAEQPWSGYGHRSIVAASLRMLARVLHEEARALPVRVQLLAIDAPVSTDANREHACPSWPTPEAIGVRTLRLVDQLEPVPARAIVRYPGPAEQPPVARESSPRGEVRALLDAVLSPTLPKEALQ
ncbi:MAG TPA: SDR family oxidoreductase [Xanthomonadales bacterium]|nr:SDR family oxidoreductase [Xanthomonadales bacterium]